MPNIIFVGESDGNAIVTVDGEEMRIRRVDKSPTIVDDPTLPDPIPNDIETPMEAATRWAKDAFGEELTGDPRDARIAELEAKMDVLLAKAGIDVSAITKLER